MNKPLKILMLNYEHPPLGGGAGVSNAEVLNIFRADKDVSIDLVTSSHDAFRIESLAGNIRIFYLDIGKNGNNQHYQSPWDLLCYSYKSWFFIKKLLKQQKYDLVHSHFSVPCGFVAKHLNIPYIVSTRGADIPFQNKKYACLDKYVFKWLVPKIWRNASNVIALSDRMKKLIVSVSPSQNVTIIPNGIDRTMFHPADTAKKNNFNFNIIAVGRLSPIKGHEYIIKGLEGLKNISLKIIGDGPLLADLTALAKDCNVNVTFTGKITRQELVKHLQISDLFVLSSLNESFCNTRLEAMSCGLPILSTPVGNFNDLCDNNGNLLNGIRIETSDSSSINYAVRHLLENKRLLSEYAEQSLLLANKYSWKRVADDYKKLYFKAYEASNFKNS